MAGNIIKALHLIIYKIIGYIEENNGNKYLTLIPCDKNKNSLKSMNNHCVKSDILLDQELTASLIAKLITWTIMLKTI